MEWRMGGRSVAETDRKCLRQYESSILLQQQQPYYKFHGQRQPGVDILLAGAAAAKPLWPAFCTTADSALLDSQLLGYYWENSYTVCFAYLNIFIWPLDGESNHCCRPACTISTKREFYFGRNVSNNVVLMVWKSLYYLCIHVKRLAPKFTRDTGDQSHIILLSALTSNNLIMLMRAVVHWALHARMHARTHAHPIIDYYYIALCFQAMSINTWIIHVYIAYITKQRYALVRKQLDYFNTH
jgi:hypothetical protein